MTNNPEHILVAVAWPYASADIHVGNITGSYLPADIYARFHRLKGNKVLMVSGSDAHGTPITVKSDAEGVTPEEVYKRYHADFLELFRKLGLNYDLFSSTHTQNHFKVSQSIFLALQRNGYLYPEKQQQWYSESENRFLPDRYVEGTCYICGYEHARGDQCDNCGNLLNANELINPRSKNDGSTPSLRETEHFFLDLSKLEPKVVEFLEARQEYWRPNVVKQSLGSIKADPLHGRAITRDLDWGIPLPIEGWDGKALYVWFEAVIGYLSAPIEWSHLVDDKDAWHDWWYNPQAKAYYFIGKDNIPFHAIMWPAELAGVGNAFSDIFEGKDSLLTLPYDVPANEFLNMEDKKISGSRNWGVWGLDFLSRYDPDPLRFYLTINMPENKDSNWDWDDFVARNNNELVANWGNLANRVLSFAHKHWEGQIPTPGELRELDKEIIATVESGFDSVGQRLNGVRLRAALQEALRLATEVNKYLDTAAPWSEVKEDKEGAAKTIYTAIRCIDNLKVLFAPFLPHTSEKLHGYLGYTRPLFGKQFTEDVSDDLGQHTVLRYDPTDASGTWQASKIEAGSPFNQPAPLYKKLETSVADEERARIAE
ncbi:MAG: methionine--tRNA ligase [Chloroflexi bacterium]|nr:MAG: methionine--tRNA ligase [Chloroflexota bacterium]MBL1194654.1 methionine--tRNA ligase [Chloroflexota bacterium]NOH11944.1 methionine--tRNA ligase [Chloroflexota bacterium]